MELPCSEEELSLYRCKEECWGWRLIGPYLVIGLFHVDLTKSPV